MKIQSPHSQAILSAHQYQGQSNDCAAYCIAMAANALKGLQLDGYQVGQELNGWVWRGILPVLRRFRNWAATPWGIVDMFRELGFKARWRLFYDEQKLQTALAAGKVVMPAIGSWKPLWAHVMILLAYDPARGWGFANSAFNKKELFWMTAEDFHKKWRWSSRLVVEAENA